MRFTLHFVPAKYTHMESLPPDHFVKSQAFTRVTHQDVYPAIDPTQDKLSQAGKVIIVTGASRGIGARVGLRTLISEPMFQKS